MSDLPTKKLFFIKRFESQYRLRLHMSLILLATIGAGLFATRVMLALHLRNVVIRYPLAVVFAYLVFFICVKLWLKCVAPSSPAKGKSAALDLISIRGGSGASSGSSSSGGGFRGGGGNFGGGGASGSFEVVPGVLAQSSAEAATGAADAGGGVAEAAGGAVGDAVSSVDLDKGCLVAVVLLAIAAIFLGAGIFLIWQAPFILAEAAFEFFLAAGLVKGARRMGGGDWMGSVFKATWIPLAITLALALLAGFLMHHFFPGVTRISELFAGSENRVK